MANQVQVQFSASIRDLIDATDRVKHAIESIKESADKAMEGFRRFGEAFGVAFSTEKIVEFIGEMAELGEQTERMGAILGVSTKEVQDLGFIAKITGGSAEQMALSMERLQLNLAKAAAGSGPAAAALQALGLRAKDLIGLPLDEQMNRIADAVSKFADGGNKTAIVMGLLGRGGAQMIPILDEGRDGLNALRQAAEESGAVMSDQTVKALASVEHNLVTMKAAAIGLGGTLVGEFSGALNTAIKGLTEFVGDLAALVSSGRLGEAAMVELSGAFRSLGQNLANTAEVLNDLVQLNWSKAVADWKAGGAQLAATAKETTDRVTDIVTKAKAEMQAALAAPEAGSGKPGAPAMDIGGGGAKGALAGIQEQIKLEQARFAQLEQHLNAEAKLGIITEAEKTQALLAALDARHGAELADLAHEEQLGNLSKAQYEKIQNEKLAIDQKYLADRQKLEDQALLQGQKNWEAGLKPIAAAYDSQLRGLLAGTTSFAEASKQVLAQLVLDIIKKFEEVAIAKAALNLQNAFGDPSAILGSILKMITASLGQVFSGITAFFAPTLGPAAPAAAAGVTAGVEATAMGMAKLDVGAYRIPGTMGAILHRDEMVLDAGNATAARKLFEGGGGSGGGPSFTFQVSALDGPGVQAFFQNNAAQIARVLQTHMAQNPSYA